MALARKDCVLGSRLAIWVLKEADLKVYLTASSEVRARRIQVREGGSLEQRLDETMRRDARIAPGICGSMELTTAIQCRHLV